MVQTFIRLHKKLLCMALLSTLAAGLATQLRAHELQPSIGDLTVADGTVTLVLRINLDAFLAEIDLDEVEDTDDAANASAYDVVRALSSDEIAARAPTLLTAWNVLPLLRVDGRAVSLSSVAVSIPEGIDIEVARIAEWTLTGPAAPDARVVQVNWPSGAGPMVLRQQGVEAPFTGYLSGGDTSPEIALGGGGAAGGWSVFASYIPVGFDHIVPKGLDHILFVLGLFFLSTQLAPLLWQVSAFTLAHTVTLALGAAGLVTVPGAIVEPLIAASIVYVALENVWGGGESRWRPLIVFGFGLLHGLGFAAVLGDFGLPEGQFLPALIGFNVGVEIGQLFVIAAAAIVIWLATRAAGRTALLEAEMPVRAYPVMFRAVSLTGSLIIAVIGAWWVIDRVFL